jgi:predicted DCC family thiol-disulfide oxidoreductase YuxK
MSQTTDNLIQLEVFYDGLCGLCRREMEWLKRKNREGKVRFTDIAAPGFDAAAYGKTWDEFMAQMYGRLPDGTWLVGLDTFDALYRVLHLGWMVRWTRWSWFRPGTDLMYRWFAKYRTKLTGRPMSRVETRETANRPAATHGSCRVHGECDASLKQTERHA